MSKRTRNILLIIAAVLLVAGLVLVAVQKSSAAAKGTAVEIEDVSPRTIEERVSASGRIFPVTEVAISSDISGEVVELFVAEGDSVRQGQQLARIDAEAYQSQVGRGEAAVNAAEANAANARASIDQFLAQRKQLEVQLSNAEQIYRRNKQLASEGLLSDVELERSQTTVATTKANIEAMDANIRAARESAKASAFNVKSAQATLNELRTQLRRTTIIIPMTGVVSSLLVEEGERVVGTAQMAGTSLMRIADLGRMEVQVEVSESDIPRVQLHDEAEIEVDAYSDRKFRGQVTEIANSASNLSAANGLSSDQVTNFIVKVSIDPASYADLVTPMRPHPFRPGMSATVNILTDIAQDALSVPIAAVTVREQQEIDGDEAALDAEDLVEVVWLVEGDTVRLQPVETGIQDRRFIQIKEGVTSGQRVVVGPYSAVSRSLKEGDEVYQEEKSATLADNNE